MEQAFREPLQEFELTTGIVGAFPNFRRPRVLWVGLQGEGMKTLEQLQQQIEQQMVAQGFPAEERAFSPHLTLGRIKFLKHYDELRQAIRALELPNHTFPVKEVHVMRSELKPSGAVYSVQRVFTLRRLG
jgi:2'-5' RNA ligase